MLIECQLNGCAFSRHIAQVMTPHSQIAFFSFELITLVVFVVVVLSFLIFIFLTTSLAGFLGLLRLGCLESLL